MSTYCDNTGRKVWKCNCPDCRAGREAVTETRMEVPKRKRMEMTVYRHMHPMELLPKMKKYKPMHTAFAKLVHDMSLIVAAREAFREEFQCEVPWGFCRLRRYPEDPGMYGLEIDGWPAVAVTESHLKKYNRDGNRSEVVLDKELDQAVRDLFYKRHGRPTRVDEPVRRVMTGCIDEFNIHGWTVDHAVVFKMADKGRPRPKPAFTEEVHKRLQEEIGKCVRDLMIGGKWLQYDEMPNTKTLRQAVNCRSVILPERLEGVEQSGEVEFTLVFDKHAKGTVNGLPVEFHMEGPNQIHIVLPGHLPIAINLA